MRPWECQGIFSKSCPPDDFFLREAILAGGIEPPSLPARNHPAASLVMPPGTHHVAVHQPSVMSDVLYDLQGNRACTAVGKRVGSCLLMQEVLGPSFLKTFRGCEEGSNVE